MERRLSIIIRCYFSILFRILYHFSAILYSEEEESTCLDASRYPSWCNAIFRLDGSEIRTRRSQHFLRSSKHFRPHRDVFLLYGSCNGTAVPKIHLVEKISYYHANGKFQYFLAYRKFKFFNIFLNSKIQNYILLYNN